jgi:hypothetical protein
MLLAEHALFCLHGSFEKPLGLAMAALDAIKLRQIGDAGECLGMLVAEDALFCLQGSLIERLGLAIAALVAIKLRQIGDGGEC